MNSLRITSVLLLLLLIASPLFAGNDVTGYRKCSKSPIILSTTASGQNTTTYFVGNQLKWSKPSLSADTAIKYKVSMVQTTGGTALLSDPLTKTRFRHSSINVGTSNWTYTVFASNDNFATQTTVGTYTQNYSSTCGDIAADSEDTEGIYTGLALRDGSDALPVAIAMENTANPSTSKLKMNTGNGTWAIALVPLNDPDFATIATNFRTTINGTIYAWRKYTDACVPNAACGNAIDPCAAKACASPICAGNGGVTTESCVAGACVASTSAPCPSGICTNGVCCTPNNAAISSTGSCATGTACPGAGQTCAAGNRCQTTPYNEAGCVSKQVCINDPGCTPPICGGTAFFTTQTIFFTNDFTCSPYYKTTYKYTNSYGSGSTSTDVLSCARPTDTEACNTLQAQVVASLDNTDAQFTAFDCVAGTFTCKRITCPIAAGTSANSVIINGDTLWAGESQPGVYQIGNLLSTCPSNFQLPSPANMAAVKKYDFLPNTGTPYVAYDFGTGEKSAWNFDGTGKFVQVENTWKSGSNYTVRCIYSNPIPAQCTIGAPCASDYVASGGTCVPITPSNCKGTITIENRNGFHNGYGGPWYQFKVEQTGASGCISTVFGDDINVSLPDAQNTILNEAGPSGSIAQACSQIAFTKITPITGTMRANYTCDAPPSDCRIVYANVIPAAAGFYPEVFINGQATYALARDNWALCLSSATAPGIVTCAEHPCVIKTGPTAIDSGFACNCSSVKCGNGVCDSADGESNITCPLDCNYACADITNATICTGDQILITTPPSSTVVNSCVANSTKCEYLCNSGYSKIGNTCSCGDGVCNNGETTATCLADCGGGGTCGNGKLEAGETCDWGTAPAMCTGVLGQCNGSISAVDSSCTTLCTCQPGYKACNGGCIRNTDSCGGSCPNGTTAGTGNFIGQCCECGAGSGNPAACGSAGAQFTCNGCHYTCPGGGCQQDADCKNLFTCTFKGHCVFNTDTGLYEHDGTDGVAITLTTQWGSTTGTDDAGTDCSSSSCCPPAGGSSSTKTASSCEDRGTTGYSANSPETWIDQGTAHAQFDITSACPHNPGFIDAFDCTSTPDQWGSDPTGTYALPIWDGEYHNGEALREVRSYCTSADGSPYP